MSRPVTLLVVFFVSMNLLASVFMSTGVAAMLGLDASVSQPCPDDPTQEQIQNIPDCSVQDQTSNSGIETGTGQGQTLFGLRNILGGQVAGLFNTVFPGLKMLDRGGVPSYLIGGFLGPLFSVLLTIALLSYARGWDL